MDVNNLGKVHGTPATYEQVEHLCKEIEELECEIGKIKKCLKEFEASFEKHRKATEKHHEVMRKVVKNSGKNDTHHVMMMQ